MATAYAMPVSPHEFGPPSSRRDFAFGGHEPSQWTPADSDASSVLHHHLHQSDQHHQHQSHHHQSRTLDSVPITRHEYRLPSHTHSYSQVPTNALPPAGTTTAMKGRPRGESDLGRPALGRTHSPTSRPTPSLNTRPRTLSSVSEPLRAGSEGFSTQFLTAFLISAPFLLSTLLTPPQTLFTFAAQAKTSLPGETGLANDGSSHLLRPLQACALAAGTLLATGMLGYVRGPEPIAAMAKSGVDRVQPNILSTSASLKLIAFRCLSVMLPFMAAAEIGGTRTALIVLVGVAAGVFLPTDRAGASKSWREVITSKKWCCLLFLSAFVYDIAWKPAHAEYGPIFRGYLALVKAALFLQPPLPTMLPDMSKLSVVRHSLQAAGAPEPGLSTARTRLTSVLIATAADTNLTLVAGVVLAVTTVLLATLMNATVSHTWMAPSVCALSIASAAGLLTMSAPQSLNSSNRFGLALGIAFVVVSGWLYDFSTLEPRLTLGAFASLAFLAIRLDSPARSAHSRGNSEAQHHHHQHHHHSHAHPSDVSTVTSFFLSLTEGWPLLHSVLASPDSRSIFYFLCINFAFMLIQLFYSVVSESLGLLSDSIHMFFDCFGMLVGLFAAVMTKWPASDRFPYGFGKVNTLSGFANGVFLIFVSIEFIWDSVERFIEGVQLKRIEELFVISVLGLVVNLIGLKLTHGHHGHDHGNSHSHDHHPANQHYSVVSEPSGGHLDLHDPSTSPAVTQVQQRHTHHDHHGDDNMLGIYLHILADTMGSVAVIVSTALTYLTGYSIWDPLASCIIAVLIIVASFPLVRSSAKKLLLTVPGDVEWKLRETLQELSGLKGVAGYGGPRFWIDDSEIVQSIGHGHSCGHDHGHAHSHDHEHHEHNHDHHHDSPSDSAGNSGGRLRILGVIHIIATRSADLDDVRKQVSEYFGERDMNVVLHVEREGAGRCWCGGDKSAIAT